MPSTAPITSDVASRELSARRRACVDAHLAGRGDLAVDRSLDADVTVDGQRADQRIARPEMHGVGLFRRCGRRCTTTSTRSARCRRSGFARVHGGSFATARRLRSQLILRVRPWCGVRRPGYELRKVFGRGLRPQDRWPKSADRQRLRQGPSRGRARRGTRRALAARRRILGREAPEDRASNHRRGGPEGKRHEDVRAADDAAVHEHRCAALRLRRRSRGARPLTRWRGRAAVHRGWKRRRLPPRRRGTPRRRRRAAPP